MKKTKMFSIVFMTIMLILISTASALGNSATSTSAVSPAAPTPKSADIPQLADENSIVDPRGQTVRQSKILNLGRTVRSDIVNPINLDLNIKGVKLLQIEVPVDLDVSFGLTFPLNVTTSYDPYDVHANQEFIYVVDVNNKDCTPYATVGLDFLLDLSKLDYQIGTIPTLDFGLKWKPITYSKVWNIPFYGVTTPIGDLVNYNIYEKEYSLDQLLSVVGLPGISKYGIKGGVGVVLNYRLHSWVTSTATVASRFGNSTTKLNYQSTGAKEVIVSVNPSAQHGELYSVTVGDWTYHIAQEVSLTLSAEIGLEVIGISLFDQKWAHTFTLGLGEITFPEKNGQTFVSRPQVLAGQSQHSVPASWSALNLDWGPSGGQFTAFDYQVAIPQNDDLKKWFTDMDVDAGVSASINIAFPFNIKSYYNSRKATNGSTIDYNVLVDSVGAANPNINYQVGGFVDLSKVKVGGFNLGRYEMATQGILFNADGFYTPFGTSYFDYEITSLVGLDTASDMLNEYISDMIYGINPDIQFRAWVILKCDGYMTGTINLVNNTAVGATVVSATDFRWDSQFDTQTTRINIPSTADAGDTFNVTYTNLVYHLSVTPGIKLRAQCLGNIVGFEYTFFIPGVSGYLSKTFTAPDFTTKVTVESMALDAKDLTVSVSDDPVTPTDFNIGGTFKLSNLGSVTDNYNIELDLSNFPSGSTGQYKISSEGGYHNMGIATTENLLGGSYWTMNYLVTLGPNAHATEYLKNNLRIKVTSVANSALNSYAALTINLQPNASLISTNVVTEQEKVQITPGVTQNVPIIVQNNGQIPVNYALAFVGSDPNVGTLSKTNFLLAAGESTTADFDVNVPELASSLPGNHTVTVRLTAAGTETKDYTIDYQVLPFSNPYVKVDENHLPDVEVNIGTDATYSFKITNVGNVAGIIEVSLVDSPAAYTVNTLAGAQNVTIASGVTGDAVIKVNAASLGPGAHSFTILMKSANITIFSASYAVNIKEVLVQCSAKSYDYIDTPIDYTISVTNLGASDTFTVSVVGLDASAYTIAEGSSEFLLPKDGAKTLTLSIKPTVITKVMAGSNGFRIGVTSKNYKYQDANCLSAVKVPIVYAFEFPSKNRTLKSFSSYMEYSFQITNKGNLGDTFTLVLEGLKGGTSAYIVSNTGATNGTIYVERGETVTITIRMVVSKDGFYFPKVNVYNSSGVLMEKISVSFGVGVFYANFGWILLGLGLAVVATVYAVMVMQRRTTAKYMSAEDKEAALTRRPAWVRSIMLKVDGIKANSAARREASEKARLESMPDATEKVADVSEEPKGFARFRREKAPKEIEQDGWNEATPEVTEDRMTMKDKIKEKIDKKREEKEEIKRLARDEKFWES